MFSSSPLVESFPSSRFPSPAPSPTRTETDDLPIEVDQSFNSSMSLSCSGGDASPSPCYFSPSMASGYGKVAPKSPSAGPSASASFLSPVPFKIGGSKPKRPDPVPIQVTSPNYRKQDEDLDLGMGTRPVGGRNFGRELSGNALSQRSIGPGTARAAMLKGKMLPPALPDNVRATTTMMSAKPRGGIPMKWSSSNEEPIVPRLTFQPAGLTRHNTEPSQSPSNPALSDSGMDIDSPGPSMSRRPSAVSATSASPSFSGAASFSGSPGLGSFFCDSPAPPAAVPTSKRRSLVAGSSPSSPSSPSAKRASYGSGRGLDSKVASSSALLFGANNARAANGLASRRGAPYKRPPLATMPIATLSPGVNDKETGQRSTSAASAYPILYGGPKSSNGLLNGSGFPKPSRPTGLLGNQPMRRAYSVCDQQQMGQMGTPGGGETEGEDESEFENSPSMSIHAEYARRNGQKFAPRVDGSPNFKPVRSSFAVPTVNCKSPTSSKSKSTKESPYGPGGLPGFGDNEMDGKILPCHKVKEDGLVRITPETLEHLLDGRYSEKIKKFHILDCRFDYEYKGGHIDGAINVKSMDNLDELLLSSNKGLYAPDESGETGQCELPAPSRSGERKEGEQVVLIFHCEFSAKRAPTFAKHLRSRDRMLNNALYPKIYYPEVYILEGGYCGFYNSRPTRCEPQGYIPMDDPKHFERRNSDLHDFRKFARTRSFTYGETQPSMSLGGGRPPLGMCPPLAFAAASAAIGRRHGPTITEEDHDHDLDSSPAPGNCLTGSPGGNNDSPCPRVVSMGNAPVFGSAKPRQLTRVGFHRVASYAGSGFSKR